MGHSANPTTYNNTRIKFDSITPSRYVVIMHNDDYTTMEFVVTMLENVFHKSNTEATHIMLDIHTKGQAACGNYPFEIAETKVEAVHRMAKKAGYPLRCSIQPG
ncbi:MAG: ATP-dependent Clp protease adaptor ClpS [Desulfuromonadaceae bacterium]|nr:ATP-dependent Clp protease adaptor ClpS [Desulfuromonas sp.]MDY0184787.1 ATP-dependent Clp protease adaptor ClpS [Desulfuromonadaceae bacterium]